MTSLWGVGAVMATGGGAWDCSVVFLAGCALCLLAAVFCSLTAVVQRGAR